MRGRVEIYQILGLYLLALPFNEDTKDTIGSLLYNYVNMMVRSNDTLLAGDITDKILDLPIEEIKKNVL